MWRIARARLHDDRGAVAVLVALSMLVLIGFAALVADAGALFQERRELQNAADAAALAVAIECAGTGCADEARNQAIAEEYAVGNQLDGHTEVHPPEIDRGQRTVRVQTSTLRGDGGTGIEAWFAQALDPEAEETTVRSAATARWDQPSILPLTLSECDFENIKAADTLPAEATISFHDPEKLKDDCSYPGFAAGIADTPGGFGWVRVNENCQAAWADRHDLGALLESGGDRIDGELAHGETGDSVLAKRERNGCTPELFEALIDESSPEVFLPLYHTVGGPPERSYTLSGLVALDLHGYHFPGQYSSGISCGNPADWCLQGTLRELEAGTALGDFVGVRLIR